MPLFTRRSFLRTAGLAGAATITGLPALADSTDKGEVLKILHTNDTHSRIDPFPDNDPNYPGMGGYARRAAIIAQQRRQNPNLLLLDAGDMFQGTPYYNLYGGEVELKLMSKMGYEAAAFGNHEFDNGLDGFKKVLPFAEFPFLAANYDFSRTILTGAIESYTIIEKAGRKIGIYGLGINPEGLVGRSLYADVKYFDPIEVAGAMEDILYTRHHCDLIICLSHLGFRYDNGKPSDVKLAANTRFTDIIIGGHTHNLLDPPVIVGNQSNKSVSIAQAGYGGAYLGMMNVYFDDPRGEKFIQAYTTKI
jgi:5'-nucleotidase